MHARAAALRPGDLKPATPRTDEPRTGLSMGEHQALTTAQWGISREAQDEIAFASHQRLAAAYEAGFFDDLITPYRGLVRDQNLRADTSLEKLATLKPVFGTRLDTPATMTAGNSTPLTDGASAVLLASEDWAQARGLTPLAAVVDAETAAVDFVHGEDGLLMAPVYAVPRLLARQGLTLADLDFVEIHEAFASTVLTTLAAWEDKEFCLTRLGLDDALGTVDRERLNVHGSSLAAGHPFAATGGRIVASVAKTLHRRRAELERHAQGRERRPAGQHRVRRELAQPQPPVHQDDEVEEHEPGHRVPPGGPHAAGVRAADRGTHPCRRRSHAADRTAMTSVTGGRARPHVRR